VRRVLFAPLLVVVQINNRDREKRLKSLESWYSPHPVSVTKHHTLRAVSHLGSDMLAECCTRPQYVPRSYCETGKSRLPGNEDVILTNMRMQKPPSKRMKLQQTAELRRVVNESCVGKRKQRYRRYCEAGTSDKRDSDT
jgi:hypothetical protein